MNTERETLIKIRQVKYLKRIAAHAHPRALRKHLREPKVSEKKGYVAGCDARPYVYIARALKAGRIDDHLESGALESVDDDWVCVFATILSGESGNMILDWTV